MHSMNEYKIIAKILGFELRSYPYSYRPCCCCDPVIRYKYKMVRTTIDWDQYKGGI